MFNSTFTWKPTLKLGDTAQPSVERTPVTHTKHTTMKIKLALHESPGTAGSETKLVPEDTEFRF